MANKTVSFLVKLDTSDVDGQIDKIKKKLTDAYRPGQNSQTQQQLQQQLENRGVIQRETGPQSKATQEAYKKSANQSKVELAKTIATEFKAAQDLGKEVEKKTQALIKQEKQQKSLNAGSQAELNLSKEILAAKNNIAKLEDLRAAKLNVVQQAEEARFAMNKSKFGKAMDSFNSGKGGGIEGMIQGAGSGGMMGAGLGALAVTMAAAAAKKIAAGYKAWERMPLETSSARGSAMSTMFGAEYQAISSGSQISEMAYKREKKEAMDEAQKASESRIATDPFADPFSERTLLNWGSTLPSWMGGDKMLESYKGIEAKQKSEDYQKSLTGKKEENQQKKTGIEYFNQNRERDLASERALGFSSADFTGQGGWLDQGTNKGFTQNQMVGASAGILGAGGSTRAARGASSSLEMQRKYDLTNSSDVMGKLSGTLGGAKETDQATIKILAEGMRLGLNASDMTEENRKFTATVAGIAAASFARSPEDVMNKAEQFSKFMGSNTMQGIAGAQEAFGQYQERSKSTSGAYGVVQSSNFLSNTLTSKLTPGTMTALMGMEDKDLSENSLTVQDAYSQYKSKLAPGEAPVSMGKFIEGLHKNKDLIRDPETLKLKGKIQAYMTKNKISHMDRAKYDAMSDEGDEGEVKRGIAHFETLGRVARAGMSPEAAEQGAFGELNQGVEDNRSPEQKKKDQAADEARLAKEAGAKPPRAGDVANQQDAETQALALKNYREFADVIGQSKTAIEDYNKVLNAGSKGFLAHPDQKTPVGGRDPATPKPSHNQPQAQHMSSGQSG
jgi:hypothetical protein